MTRTTPLFAAALLALAATASAQDLRLRIGNGHSEAYKEQQQKQADQAQRDAAGSVAAPPTPALRQRASDWIGQTRGRADLLVVGVAGALSPMDTDERQGFHQAWREVLQKREAGRMQTVPMAGFVHDIAAWTTVELRSVAGLYRDDLAVAVPAQLADPKAHPSLEGSLWLGRTGDLVAAGTNADGMLVLQRTLCRAAQPDFHRCSQAYARGRFDAHSGTELDSTLRPLGGGRRIDTETLRPVGGEG